MMPPNRVVHLLTATTLVLTLASACGTTRDAEGDGTVVDVRNRNWLSMEIYVVGPAQRIRLGRVASGATRRFRIPAYLLSGATPLRFVMESSGPTPAIFSETFVVAPGEEVILVIPNTR